MLVDTSVWINHLRQRNPLLAEQLDDGLIWTHPFVVGELACGNLAQRGKILSLFDALPVVPVADHEEVLSFAESRRLMGRGIGWIDMHLLASAMLAPVPLWTSDQRLSDVAREIGVACNSI